MNHHTSLLPSSVLKFQHVLTFRLPVSSRCSSVRDLQAGQQASHPDAPREHVCAGRDVGDRQTWRRSRPGQNELHGRWETEKTHLVLEDIVCYCTFVRRKTNLAFVISSLCWILVFWSTQKELSWSWMPPRSTQRWDSTRDCSSARAAKWISWWGPRCPPVQTYVNYHLSRFYICPPRPVPPPPRRHWRSSRVRSEERPTSWNRWALKTSPPNSPTTTGSCSPPCTR